MIRPLLRKLKHFFWRHSGLAALTEQHTRTIEALVRVQGLLEQHGQALGQLAADHATVRRLAADAEELRGLIADTRRQAEAEHERTRRGLDQRLQGMHAQLVHVEAFYQTLGQIQHDLLGLRETVQELQGCVMDRHAFDEQQHLLRAGLDERLQLLHAQLVHVEAFYQTLGGLQGNVERLAAAAEETKVTQLDRHHFDEQQAELRLAIDRRLEMMNAQLVHIESIWKQLAHLGTVQDRLGSAFAELERLGLDRWKIQEYEGLLRYLRRRPYEQAIQEGRLEVPAVETDHPLALDTDDSRFPWGAKNDNSICLKFNSRLYQLFPGKPRLAVLDLGCAGGGFVRSLLDDGHFAVGLEGSDHPKVHRLGEWGTIPHHLHTCDITRPFTLRDRATGAPLRFDVITAWEVMEHIHDRDLDTLLQNISNHLAEGGLFLCSISTVEDGNPELGAVYHQTVQPYDWWVSRLGGLGFEVVPQNVIGKDDWLRGSANCRLDRHAEDEGVGFHLVLRRRQQLLAAA